MLICISCEIEVDEGLTACPKCGGSLDEVLDDELDDLEEEEETEEGVEEGEDEAPAGPEEPAPAPEPPAPPESPVEAPSEPSAPQSPDPAPPEPPVETPPPSPPEEEPAAKEKTDKDKDKEEERRLRREKARERREKRGKTDRIKKERPERKKREKREKPERKKKDKTDRKKRGKEKEPAKPKEPKSIRLSQRRLPVLLATWMTLFVSLYMISDFVIALMVGQRHALQVLLGAAGLMAAAFLFGHGRLGRLGAFTLGICGLAAGVFFKFSWSLENYLFIVAMFGYNLVLIFTLLGKGWFLRTALGFVFSLLVMVGCLGSLALDFVPGIAYKHAEDAVGMVDQALNTMDEAKIAEARKYPEQSLKMHQELLTYLDKIPFDKLPDFGKTGLYFLLGQTRVSRLYFTPVRLQRKIYQLSPELARKTETITFTGADWVELAEPSVEQDTVKILRPGWEEKKEEDPDGLGESKHFVPGFDFEVEYGGLGEKSRVRRMATGNVPDGEPVQVEYQYFSTARSEMIESAWTYVLGAKNFLTGGDPSQYGPAIGEEFGKPSGGKVLLDNRGRRMLENFLFFDSQYVWIHAEKAITLLAEGTAAGDEAKIAEGRKKAEEVLTFYEKELFNTLGWLLKMVDPDDDQHRNGADLLGDNEYPFIFLNFVRLHWALYEAGGKKPEDAKTHFEPARSQMVQAREIVTAGEPVKARELMQRRINRYEQREIRLWFARWRIALKLLDQIETEQERLDQIAGTAPQQEKLVEQPGWDRKKDSENRGVYRLMMKGWTVVPAKGEILFTVELRDPANLLEGKGLPVFRDFQLRREMLFFELGIVSGGPNESKLRFTLKEMLGTDPDGKVVEGQVFPTEIRQAAWIAGEQEIINPQFEWGKSKTPEWWDDVQGVKVVIEITRG
jgi:hypothetical protein